MRKSSPCFIIINFIVLVCGCSLQKETRINRGLQNLTARYNIIFNANNLIAQREDELAIGYTDRYDDFLRVFPDTGGCTDAKIPDSVIKKAQVIISDKSQSNYVGEAYFLEGQASYFKCDFYNAIEYFDYVYHTYPKATTLGIKARSWKARTLMLSGEEELAGRLLDSAIKLNDTLKKPDPIAYETKLLWSVNEGEYAGAEKLAQKALDLGLPKRQEWRIRFLLAQLQEINKKNNEAYANYTKIEHSNAPFEMAFNASLNKIRIIDAADGRKVDRSIRMIQLLKDDKNRDFQDQIYYQIAQLKQAEKKYDEAEKYYNLSIKNSTKNQTQKGLAYLRLAELSISRNSDYIAAGGFYEDALTNLPQTYPGYLLIKKKAQNLQFISGKTGIISREDTLQMLAKLPEADRITKIAQIADSQVKKEQIQNTGVFSGYAEPNMESPQTQITTVGAFYFDNTNAVSQGFSSFKRRWGDRKLADNWRSSTKGQPELVPTAALAPDPDSFTNGLPPGVLPNTQSVDQLKAGYSKDLPISPALLQQSNTRIIAALLDLANYYRDELLDTAETIKTYQTLLLRFPDYGDKPSVYYNLFRLNQEKNAVKSTTYRDTLTRLYPQSSYTQAINDPEYFNKMSQASAGIILAYEKVYDLYAGRDYKATVDQADTFAGQTPGTVFSPQVAYLKAIATGHLQKLDVFETALKNIVTLYPNDRLVVPLIKQHLTYIDSNRTAMVKRPVALLDHDPNEPPFFEQEEAVFATGNSQSPMRKSADRAIKQPVIPVNPNAEKTTVKPASENDAVKAAPEKPAETEINNTPFSLGESTNYYFVINVASANVNLSSSRFGIGQFNRANFQGDNIKHQLKIVGSTNQLIYVGRFFSLDAVKDYARNIAPLIPEIMKVPKEQYTFFVTTQENLDKLADKNLLQQYMGFYEKFILK